MSDVLEILAETRVVSPRERFQRVRKQTENLCQPLELEDYCIQAAAFASPVKWHLAHITWFFETFILKPYCMGYEVFHPDFEHLFNSYYQGVGLPFPRSHRGWLSRPTVAEVYAYRKHVDAAVDSLLGDPSVTDWEEVHARLNLGLNHEEQHQELLLMDLKYNLGNNPLFPAYHRSVLEKQADAGIAVFVPFEEGIARIGYKGAGFCFDNEQPEHRVFLESYALADRLVTNREYLDFVMDKGYQRPDLWLSDGWDGVVAGRWRLPAYWLERAGRFYEFTLAGLVPLDPAAPVCHVNYFEADAYARWAGKRLPTEQEWEHAAGRQPLVGHFADVSRFHPRSAEASPGPLRQIYGDLWEWTASAYLPYPGYTPAEGAIGEYNGKFMCGQQVLRGGACVTPLGHTRLSYRNFFYPDQRWQFCGIRLAQSL